MTNLPGFIDVVTENGELTLINVAAITRVTYVQTSTLITTSEGTVSVLRSTESYDLLTARIAKVMTGVMPVLTKEQQVTCTKSVRTLGLSTRCCSALACNGIATIENLIECTPVQLRTYRNLGEVGLREITDALNTHNLTLAEEAS